MIMSDNSIPIRASYICSESDSDSDSKPVIMSDKSIPSKPVIIIGAGLSGLYAAKILSDYKVPVTVLEAGNRVGGRSFTEKTPISNKGDAVVDQGAGYVGWPQKVVIGLCHHYGIQIPKVPNYCQGRYTFSLKKKVFHSYCPLDDLFKYLSPMEFFNMVMTMIKTWSLGRSIKLDSPWNAKMAKDWDAMTFDNWIDTCFPRSKNGDFENARTMFQFVSRTPLGIEPPETSLLYFLWYIRSADTLFSLLFAAQDRFVVGGTQQISERLMAELPSDTVTVKLSHPATHIQHDGSGVTVTANLQYFQGDRALLAITPHVRSRLTYDPLVSPMHQQLCQRSPMGTTIKIHLFYSEHIWKNDGYNGNCTIFDGQSVSQVYDVTEPESKNYCLQAFYVGDAGRSAAQQDKNWRKEDVMNEMKRVFGGNDAYLKPIGYSEYIWDNHTYVGGAPVGTCATGTLTNFGKALRGRGNSERIHYAGTETSTHWAGYMEGALRAGERAAHEILHEYGVKHDPLSEPDNSLTTEARDTLTMFMQYAAKAAREMPKVAPFVQKTAGKTHALPMALHALTQEGFDNTDNWLCDYLSDNPEDAAAIQAGIQELDHFKKQLLAA